MSTAIREYQAADLERCRELWRSLTERHREIYSDPTIGGSDPGVEFDAHLDHPNLHRVWVAAARDTLLGLCGLLVHGEESELEPIVVDPARRNAGVGGALAQYAIAESKRIGVKYVNVRPVARNLEAIRFFHREGFRLLGRLELSIPLEGATPFGSSQTAEVHGLSFDC